MSITSLDPPTPCSKYTLLLTMIRLSVDEQHFEALKIFDILQVLTFVSIKILSVFEYNAIAL